MLEATNERCWKDRADDAREDIRRNDACKDIGHKGAGAACFHFIT